MKLISATNPSWANRSQTLINLTVRFEGIDEDLPFTADPNDVEAYGRDIYARAAAGEFGAVASFEATPTTTEQVSNAVRQERNRKLETEVDPIVSNPLRWEDLTPEQQQAVANYRRALLDMTDDAAFPWYDLVVSETDFGFDVDVFKAPWPINPME
jgi:hypothetical protein